MQLVLLSKRELDLIQRTHHMALRIIFGVPWNASKTAMSKLACLESAKCRNLLLNASFVNNRLSKEDTRNPTCNRMKELRNKSGSLIKSWFSKNKFIKKLREAESYKAEKFKIKHEDIKKASFGATAVSDAIIVPMVLKHSAILKWTNVEDAKMKKNIIRWRLGRIAFHQACTNCNGSAELSRKHALECTRMNELITEVYTDVNMEEGFLSIDNVLNSHYKNVSITTLSMLDTIISNISSMCNNTSA